ncbi:hypothetical protein ABT262_46070, partial [Amycolatopsis mediterranei]
MPRQDLLRRTDGAETPGGDRPYDVPDPQAPGGFRRGSAGGYAFAGGSAGGYVFAGGSAGGYV